MFIVITFKILILNLIIAILSNTYNMFDTKSTGLYLSKILNSRDDLAFDENYGACLLQMAPLNLLVYPFNLFAIFKKPSPALNYFAIIIQYSMLIVIICLFYMIGCLLLIPFAYFKSIQVKLQKCFGNEPWKEKLVIWLKLFGFIVLGIPILSLTIMGDFYYFWKNNFRSNLKKIIIERSKSSITNESIRLIVMQCSRYSGQKIKSVYTTDLIKSFRDKFTVKENIQYLLFGQMIPAGGFKNNYQANTQENLIKSMKTTNLKEYQEAVKALEDTSAQTNKSMHEIDQYNQVKSILINFSFENDNQKQLSVEIIEGVIDEIRRERKIRMVLADERIEEYIKLDLEGNVDDVPSEQQDFFKQVLEDKKKFRADMCQKVSILRLGYMLKVLQAVHPGKATMLSAEAFKVKVLKLQSAESKRNQFIQQMAAGGRESMNSLAIKEKNNTMIIDPLLKNINEFVRKIREQINEFGTEQAQKFEVLIREATGIKKQSTYGALTNQHTVKNMKLDTVEENLQELEGKYTKEEDREETAGMMTSF